MYNIVIPIATYKVIKLPYLSKQLLVQMPSNTRTELCIFNRPMYVVRYYKINKVSTYNQSNYNI